MTGLRASGSKPGFSATLGSFLSHLHFRVEARHEDDTAGEYDPSLDTVLYYKPQPGNFTGVITHILRFCDGFLIWKLFFLTWLFWRDV